MITSTTQVHQGWRPSSRLFAAGMLSLIMALLLTLFWNPTISQGQAQNMLGIVPFTTESCPAGTTLIKFENPSGTQTQGPITLTVTRTEDGEPMEVSFTVTGGILVYIVYVKGGPGFRTYDYRPDGTSGDSGLVAPINTGTKTYGISHVTFCYGEQSTPTRTNTALLPTSTEVDNTATVATNTPTLPSSTETTVATNTPTLPSSTETTVATNTPTLPSSTEVVNTATLPNNTALLPTSTEVVNTATLPNNTALLPTSTGVAATATLPNNTALLPTSTEVATTATSTGVVLPETGERSATPTDVVLPETGERSATPTGVVLPETGERNPPPAGLPGVENRPETMPVTAGEESLLMLKLLISLALAVLGLGLCVRGFDLRGQRR